MEVVRETLWKRCLSTPTKPSAKNSNICLSETAYQHKGTRKKCKKANEAAIIQWQRQWLMDKPHRKPWPKSKTSDIFKQSHSPLHHTFWLGRARFTAQLTWDQAQFERFSYILSNGYRWNWPPECNFQSETKIEPDLRLPPNLYPPPRVWAYQRPRASHLNALDFAPHWRFIHIQICFKEPKACEWKLFWRALFQFSV